MITLVLGGIRSGKSEVAERLAARAGEPISYVATGSATDDDFLRRIDAHRARRPSTWTTIELPADLGATLMRIEGTVIVDSLGTWVAGAPDCQADVDGLSRGLSSRRGASIVVSDEVGLCVHPQTEIGIRFADELGECNRRIAHVAHRVLLVVAGHALDLQPDY